MKETERRDNPRTSLNLSFIKRGEGMEEQNLQWARGGEKVRKTLFTFFFLDL